ncbi:gamma carbonic anhydrase family protein [Exiguobacterium sp. UBA6309]|uniref:gamma carbonic anhydrase family protein n=1 Tax=Exiguobacterium sp. UBA6309 TaxID=1946499 RepID=UPI0025C03B75|nr:gamma carbonic anhydrase family protein [Exiguobacterium sp. UBA6309]
MKIPYQSIHPNVASDVFIAPGAYLIGDVTIGSESTIWFNAVLRGDEGPITIGKRCSIQDNATIHLYEGAPVVIEDEVTVGHNAILHGCKIGRRSIVGMGATVLDHADIGEECIIGANTMIPSGKVFPPRSLIIGSPGKVVRELTEADLAMIQESIDSYVDKGYAFRNILAGSAEQNTSE